MSYAKFIIEHCDFLEAKEWAEYYKTLFLEYGIETELATADSIMTELWKKEKQE